MYVPSAETQDHAAYMDAVYAELARYLSEHPDFEYLDVEVIQEDLGEILLSDYVFKVDPVKLLYLKERSLLNAIVFIEITQSDTGVICRAKAHEFPSNIRIAQVSVPISNPKNSDPQRLLNKILPILDLIKYKASDIGYAFPEAEKGIVLLADDYDDPVFQSALREFTAMRKTYTSEGDISALAAKVLFFDPVSEPDTTEAVQTILRQSNTEALFRFNVSEDSQWVYLPYSQFQWPVFKNTLPLWPPLSHFTMFRTIVDSVFAHEWGLSIFALQQRKKADIQMANDYVSIMLKQCQLLESILYINGSDSLLSHNLTKLYSKLLDLYNYDMELAWIHANYAKFLCHYQKNESAVQQFEQAKQFFEMHDQYFGMLLTLMEQANVYETLGQFSNAQDNLQNALVYSNLLEDTDATAHIYYRLGSLSYASDKRLQAWEYFGFSVDQYFELGDTLQVVQIYTKMGILMRQSRTLAKSQEYLEQSLQLAQKIGNDREIAYAHYQLAVTLFELSSLSDALQNFEHAADWMEILGDTLNLANCEEHIGDILVRQQRFQEAQHGFEAAARYYRAAQFTEGLIRTLVKLGDVTTEQNKWQRAQQSYEEAIALARQQDNREWISIALYKKGLAHVKEGELQLGQQELELAQESLSMDPQDIESYMQRLLNELENELNSLRTIQE